MTRPVLIYFATELPGRDGFLHYGPLAFTGDGAPAEVHLSGFIAVTDCTGKSMAALSAGGQAPALVSKSGARAVELDQTR